MRCQSSPKPPSAPCDANGETNKEMSAGRATTCHPTSHGDLTSNSITPTSKMPATLSSGRLRKRPKKNHKDIAPTQGQAVPGAFLFLCVNPSMLSQSLGQIQLVDDAASADHITDEALCRNLQNEYRRLRGWRYWISLQVIYYFRFVKVHPYDPHPRTPPFAIPPHPS